MGAGSLPLPSTNHSFEKTLSLEHGGAHGVHGGGARAVPPGGRLAALRCGVRRRLSHLAVARASHITAGGMFARSWPLRSAATRLPVRVSAFASPELCSATARARDGGAHLCALRQHGHWRVLASPRLSSAP